MSNSTPQTGGFQPMGAGKIALQFLKLIGVLALFLLALEMMGDSFDGFRDDAKNWLGAVSNPLVGLFVGMLATAIIQSSSATTSMLVTLVAGGALTLPEAVPMLMGANIGTSVTSTIVSLGHIANKEEYERALSAATVHDFFNIITVIIMMLIETLPRAFGYEMGGLSAVADYVSQFVTPSSGGKMGGIMSWTIKPMAGYIAELLGEKMYLTLPVALVLLFISLRLLTQLLQTLVIGKVQENLDKYVFGHPVKSIFAGFVSTAAVQSSSVTSSLMVPLVAAGKVSIERAFPFLMGANIGTTTTALIAAVFFAKEGAGAAGVAAALAHLFFNLFGVFLLFPIPFVRNIPIRMAKWLGAASLKNRFVGIAYVVIAFFLIPILLILVTGGLG